MLELKATSSSLLSFSRLRSILIPSLRRRWFMALHIPTVSFSAAFSWMPPPAAGVVAASCLVVHTTPLAEGGIEIPLAKLIGFTYAISYCRKLYKFFCIFWSWCTYA